MFLINGMKAKLIQFNRSDDDNVFDDENRKEVIIKCCPYNVDQAINFGIYTVPEATGYYQVPRWVDVREGDQIIFLGGRLKDTRFREQVHTILKVQDEWLFNRVENYIIAVK